MPRAFCFVFGKEKPHFMQVGRSFSELHWLSEDAYNSGNYAGYKCHNGCPELHVSSHGFTVFSLVLRRNLRFHLFSVTLFVSDKKHLLSRRRLPAPSSTGRGFLRFTGLPTIPVGQPINPEKLRRKHNTNFSSRLELLPRARASERIEEHPENS